MIKIDDLKKCSGCTACEASCPVKAISFKLIDSFYYPFVNNNKCINCDICLRVCPYQNLEDSITVKPPLYAFQSGNNSLKTRSTAGGFFGELALYFLKQNGVIYGAKFSENKISHYRVTKENEVEQILGSKYVQSNLSDIFLSVKDDLKNNKQVLFAGTPCQVYGLKYFLKENFNNLITIDFLCYGVSSPEIFNKYCEYIEAKYNSKISNYVFRDKTLGYSTSNPLIVLENKKKIYQCYDAKCYLETFFKNYNVRPSCYDCKFRKNNPVSDFTMGDFVDIGIYNKKFDDDKGTTRVWVNTDSAFKLLNKLGSSNKTILIENNNFLDARKNKLSSPSNRDEILGYFEEFPFKKAITDKFPNNFKKKIICVFRRVTRFIPFSKYVLKSIRRKQYLKFNNKQHD